MFRGAIAMRSLAGGQTLWPPRRFMRPLAPPSSFNWTLHSKPWRNRVTRRLGLSTAVVM